MEGPIGGPYGGPYGELYGGPHGGHLSAASVIEKDTFAANTLDLGVLCCVGSKVDLFARVQISLFFVIFGFWSFFGFLRPKWAREGFHRVQGWIPLHVYQVSAQMGPSWAQWGSFLFFNFPKRHLGPK